MKLLLVLLLLGSCAGLPVKRGEDNIAATKMEECITKFIGKFAIKAKIAQEVCESIHKKGE